MKYMILSLSVIFLSSCSGFKTQTSQPIQSQNMPTVVSETETLPLTPSPVPTSTILDFPSWMSNPDAIVLAALIRDDVAQTLEIHFFNAATGEKFELDASRDFGGFFWYDNMSFGIIVENSNNANKYDLKTGQVSTQSAPTFQPDDYWKSKKSPNKQYIAQWDSDDKVITVASTKTNEVIWELALPENRYGTEVLWSPVNENHLAFLQGSPDLSGKITENMTLNIVDVAEGKILSTYNGNFGVVEWSPNGKMILYLDPSFLYRNFGIPFQDAPCLLIVETGEKKCLRSIPRMIPTGYELLTTGGYKWASDSNSVFYTYTYNLPSQWNSLGNLCIYSLIDSHITCPTQDLKVLHGRSVIYYDLSPNEQFIHFCYSDSTLLNDAADESNDGIIKIDGSGFFSWVGTTIKGAPSQTCSIETFWRPLP